MLAHGLRLRYFDRQAMIDGGHLELQGDRPKAGGMCRLPLIPNNLDVYDDGVSKHVVC